MKAKIPEPTLQLFTGIKINPFRLTPDHIDINDIIQSLSMQCRYNGHIRSFYSVAEHSVYVSYVCDPQDALWGLLHDASEAYLKDLQHPLKIQPQFSFYRKTEKKVQEVICEKFNLPKKEPYSVKLADKRLLLTEKKFFNRNGGDDHIKKIFGKKLTITDVHIQCLYPDKAQDLFKKRFEELMSLEKP